MLSPARHSPRLLLTATLSRRALSFSPHHRLFHNSSTRSQQSQSQSQSKPQPQSQSQSQLPVLPILAITALSSGAYALLVNSRAGQTQPKPSE